METVKWDWKILCDINNFPFFHISYHAPILILLKIELAYIKLVVLRIFSQKSKLRTLSENEIRDQDSAFANASLSCSSRDNRVNARPRGCALRRAESGCELSRGSFNRGGNEAEQSDEKARRRVMRTMRYVNTQLP